MPKYKIQMDDTVIVTTGKHKGATGRVIDILTDTDRIIIEQVNLVTRQVKPQGGQAGGTIEKSRDGSPRFVKQPQCLNS